MTEERPCYEHGMRECKTCGASPSAPRFWNRNGLNLTDEEFLERCSSSEYTLIRADKLKSYLELEARLAKAKGALLGLIQVEPDADDGGGHYEDCAKLGFDYEQGGEPECDCGIDERWAAARDALKELEDGK